MHAVPRLRSLLRQFGLIGLVCVMPWFVQKHFGSVGAQAVVATPVSFAEVLAVYPHDAHAFTEGLLFHNGMLYESTGIEGHSTIRQVDLATGHIIRSVSLPAAAFGEGIAAWHDQILSVTWHGGTGYRWQLPALTPAGEFHYAGEGWGMTSDGHHVILSDGTSRLRFLDAVSLTVVGTLAVTDNGMPLANLNELESVDGEILANVWMTNRIARIDPRTGRVRGWIDLSILAARAGVTDVNAVANGIAWDPLKHRLFVTGKLWPLMFEIRPPRGLR